VADLRTSLNAFGPSPADELSADPEQLLQVRLLARLGQALNAAGDPVSSTRDALSHAAQAYAIPEVEIGVLPTLVFVRAGEHRTPIVELASATPSGPNKDLRLDQITALYAIVAKVERGQLAANAALADLEEMWRQPARFGFTTRVVGHATLAAGLGLILTPRPSALLWCLGLGFLVGIAKQFGNRWAATDVLLPVFASLLVSLIVFEATLAGLIVSPLLLLIPPLISFLPGGMLTTAMIELADGHTMSGATRLVAGSTQVVFLVFGIVAAESIVGIPASQAYALRTDNLLGWWGPVLGPLVFALGIELYAVGPVGSLGWLILVVYVAWAGESVGTHYLSGYFGAFIGATLMTLVSYTVGRIPAAPPSRVLFLPAFWLLVPGSLAVVGVAELVGSDLDIALDSLGTAAFTIVSIALGVVVGIGLSRLARRSAPPDSS
jgi:uncharacterized membrane protein YjjP (DUF1212 family)